MTRTPSVHQPDEGLDPPLSGSIRNGGSRIGSSAEKKGTPQIASARPPEEENGMMSSNVLPKSTSKEPRTSLHKTPRPGAVPEPQLRRADPLRQSMPGAVAVPGIDGEVRRPSSQQYDSSRQTVANNHDDEDHDPVVHVEAQLVDEEAQQNSDIMMVAIAKKDSFWKLLRHDRRTQMMAAGVLVAVIALGVGLGVALSKSSSGVVEQTYLQAGADIDGPDNTFGLGSGEDSMFGSSASLTGNGSRIVVGAPSFTNAGGNASTGLVQVFEEQGDDWTLLEPSIVGDAPGDRTGSSVAFSLDGSTIAVGSPGHSNKRGQVKIYSFVSGSWEQLGQTILGETEGDGLGTSVSISEDGRRAAVGMLDETSGNDRAKVFEFIGAEWIQLGDDLEGRFGGNPISLSADGSTVAMGSLSTADNDFVGAIRVFEFDEGNWVIRGSDIMLQGAVGSYDTGWSTSISRDGKTVAIGSSVENARAIEEYDLRVLIYRFDEELRDWTQQGETQHDLTGSHLIAYTVSLSADARVLAIGDPGGFARGINSGHAHVLRWQDGEWFHISRELEGTDAADSFGQAVSLSADGSRIGVGAPNSRATGREVGRVQIYELADVE